jgi:hypothetical protein
LGINIFHDHLESHKDTKTQSEMRIKRHFHFLQNISFLITFLLLFSCTTSRLLPLVEKDLLPPNADETYNSLAQQLKSGQTEIDYGLLRLCSAARKTYNPFDKDPQTRGLAALIVAGNKAAVSQKIDELFLSHCADPDFHKLAAGYYSQTGEEKLSAFHRLLRDRLLQSIFSGRGQSDPDNAFFIVHFNEADAVFDALNLKPISFTHEEKNGRHLEIFTAVNAAGERISLYFNVAVIYRWLEKQLNK